MDPLIQSLAKVVSQSEGLEGLVRPLLEILESVTGLESTYLTLVDLANQEQRILFARNTQALEIPEGLSVPWDDTLCKRAIDEGCFCTQDVSQHWGDSEAARALGIDTYLSFPIHILDDSLYGTLCGASSSRKAVSEEAQQVLAMFGKLIARQVERELLLDKLQQENQTVRQHALTDPLTGLANRRALLADLARTLELARRSQGVVHLAFIDLDGFKSINDTYGHDGGDRFLLQIAHKLAAGMREADVLGRYGGDEFLVFGLGLSNDTSAARAAFQRRIELLTQGRFRICGATYQYPGASVGVVTSGPGETRPEDLIARADQAMYVTKQQRSQERKTATGAS